MIDFVKNMFHWYHSSDDVTLERQVMSYDYMLFTITQACYNEYSYEMLCW